MNSRECSPWSASECATRYGSCSRRTRLCWGGARLENILPACLTHTLGIARTLPWIARGAARVESSFSKAGGACFGYLTMNSFAGQKGPGGQAGASGPQGLSARHSTQTAMRLRQLQQWVRSAHDAWRVPMIWIV